MSLQQNNKNSESKILAEAREAAVAKSELNVMCDMDYKKVILVIFCHLIHLVLNAVRRGWLG